MSHTNTTPNYNLPQFVGSDKPAWLTDINNAMSAIDTAIAAAKSAADNAGGAAASLATTVGGHTTQLETLSTIVTNQGTAIVSQGNAINTISELIGNGTPTTTDHTLIGAINELNAKEGDLSDLTTTDKSSLVAAINEAAQGGGGGGSAWTLTGTETGNTAISVPNGANEILVFINNNRVSASVYADAFTSIIPVDALDATTPAQIAIISATGTTDSDMKVSVRATKTSVNLQQSESGSSDLLSSTTIKVYYR